MASIARYLGGARLWQGANVVEAPSIEFDRPNRSLIAQGTVSTPVTSVFVQIDKRGKTTPVCVVTAARLVYNDSERRARSHRRRARPARGDAMTMNSAAADVMLVPAQTRLKDLSLAPANLTTSLPRQYRRPAAGPAGDSVNRLTLLLMRSLS